MLQMHVILLDPPVSFHLTYQTIDVHAVEMDDAHREAYNSLFNSARAAFRAALAEGDGEV